MGKHSVFLFLMLVRAFIGLGQVNWPEDENLEKTAKEKLALYSDALKNEQYKAASQPLQWLLQNVPQLSESIYIDGAKVFQQMAMQASLQEKAMLSNQVMQIFDQRASYFPEGSELLNRKAWAAYKLYQNVPEQSDYLFNLLKSTIDSLQEDIYKSLLLAQMDMLRKHAGKLNQDQLFETYFRVKELLQAKAAHGEAVDYENKMTDKIFFSLVNLNCDVITEKFAVAPSADKQKMKLYLGLALAHQCYNVSTFVPVAEAVLHENPDYGLTKLVAIILTKNNDLDQALTYWQEALKLSKDPEQKAEIYLSLAGLFQQMHQFEKAREQINKALSTGTADDKKAYNLLGDLYVQSYSRCKKGKSKVQDLSVSIAAWEMYAKAGNQERMQQMEKSFPSREELHSEDLSPGDAYQVGCWINRQVILRSRD